MTKTLFLHIGMPKCASSAAQAFMELHSRELAEQGYHYEMWGQDRTRGQGNATVLHHLLTGQKDAELDACLDFYLKRDSHVILSSELLVAQGRMKRPNRLLDRAREEGFAIKALCFLRRQDRWIESDFKQHIKGGTPWTDTIEALIEKRRSRQVLDYNWVLGNWARKLGRENITIAPINPGAKSDEALRKLVGFLGADDSKLDYGRKLRSNISPPTCLTEPARQIKRHLLTQGVAENDVRRMLQGFFVTAPDVVTMTQRRFLMSAQMRAALVEEYAESNAALSQAFFDGKPVFDDLIDAEAEDLLPLDTEAAQILLSFMEAGSGKLSDRLSRKSLRVLASYMTDIQFYLRRLLKRP